MRYLIIALLFVVSSVAQAIEVPEYLKGGVITVTLSNGTQYTFKSEDYAVVPRLPVDKDGVIIERIYKADAYKVKPTTIRVYGGAGPDGLSIVPQGEGVMVEQDYGFNYAVGVGRALSNTISLDGLMLLNRHGVQGGLLGVGYSF